MLQLIYVSFFAESADIDTLARGIRVVLQLAQTEPFRSIIDQDADEKTMPWIYPGNKHPDEVSLLHPQPVSFPVHILSESWVLTVEQISDNDLKVWIAKNGNGTWHPVRLVPVLLTLSNLNSDVLCSHGSFA